MKRLVGVALMVAGTAALADTSYPAGTAIGVAGGRYAMGQISSARHDQYMLDTQTGRLWIFVCMKKEDNIGTCGQMALQPVPYVDLQGQSAGYTAPPIPKQ